MLADLGEVFDGAVLEFIEMFQKRHGRKPTQEEIEEIKQSSNNASKQNVAVVTPKMKIPDISDTLNLESKPELSDEEALYKKHVPTTRKLELQKAIEAAQPKPAKPQPTKKIRIRVKPVSIPT